MKRRGSRSYSKRKRYLTESQINQNLRRSLLRQQYNAALAQQNITALQEQAGVKKILDGARTRSLIRGRGDYDMGNYLNNPRPKVRANEYILGSGMPRMETKSTATGGVIVRNTEFVRDIYAPTIAAGTSSGFSTQSFSINPGLQEFAPKLSQIACNYEEYKILQCIVMLEPLISQSIVSDSGVTGQVLACVQYKVNEDSAHTFRNKDMMLQHSGYVCGPITDDIVIGVECHPAAVKENDYYVRTTGLTSGEKYSDYDHAMVTIGLHNIRSEYSEQAIYQMKVFYTVELRNVKSGALSVINQQVDKFACNGSYSVVTVDGTSHWSTAHVSGDNGIVKMAANSIGGFIRLASYTNDTRQLFWQYVWPSFKSGRFQLILTIIGEGMSLDEEGHTKGGQVRNVSDIMGGATSSNAASYRALSHSSTRIVYMCHVDVDAAVGGEENFFQINLLFNDACEILRWGFVIEEINNSFSQSHSIDTPEWKNLKDNVVVQP